MAMTSSSISRDVSENDAAAAIGRSLFFQNKKSGFVDVMQNCDLPPPLRVFSGADSTVLSSMNRICGTVAKQGDDYDEHEKLELLKALRLSQTRAREAEKRAAGLTKERDCISKAFFEESLRLLAYRQWMRLLEIQLSKLKSQEQEQDDDNAEDAGTEVSWFVALALCFGFVGVGFALGCRLKPYIS